MKKIIPFLFLILFCIPVAKAEWNQEKIKGLTKEIQKEIKEWTIEDTKLMLREAKFASDYNFARFSNGKMVSIKVIGGETVLLNGKDISGHLGSKITHGDNSPIIEDIVDSQIAVGKQATVSGKNINFNLTIALSFALTISFVFNLCFIRKIKKLTK